MISMVCNKAMTAHTNYVQSCDETSVIDTIVRVKSLMASVNDYALISFFFFLLGIEAHYCDSHGILLNGRSSCDGRNTLLAHHTLQFIKYILFPVLGYG